MSVNSHLTNTASKIIITDSERTMIDNHLTSLKVKLGSYFSNAQVKEQIAFGSYTRKTLMPRKADAESDVDYMVVFDNSNSYTPSTYLRWLKDFATAKYATSEIYPSHPTVVLELSKIKIELVPATKNAYDNYQIPAPTSSFTTWLTTHPNAFNESVRAKNTAEKKLIRPLIRLMKYWNAKNGYVYSSYNLEQLIIAQPYYFCNNLSDYLYTFVAGLSSLSLPTSKAEKVTKLKNICSQAKNLDIASYPIEAEAKIKEAFPEY